MLSLQDFKQLVTNAPLFAIDLVVVNKNNQILVGERVNAPARGYWFVPGGRVYKNETLEMAVTRISKAELGIQLQREQLRFIGLYDHLYEDSFMSPDISTHYINATHAIKLNTEGLPLPHDQHLNYRWLSLRDLENEQTVHTFSKVFLPELKKWLDHD